jgi:hypothetical protein
MSWRRLGIDTSLDPITWRRTLTGVLIGFLIGQMIALAAIALSQAKKARDGKALEIAPHVMEAVCFELASRGARADCLVGSATEGVGF